MTRTLLTASVLLVVALSRATTATADTTTPDAAPLKTPATSVSGADKARARALIKSGDVHYRLFKFERALASYQEAYRLTQHPAIAFNIAQAFRQLKDHVKARFYYKLFLSDWSRRYPDKPPPYEAEVREHIQRLSRLIAAAGKGRDRARQPEPGSRPVALARLELEGLRPGARILVDGRERKGGPELAVSPGKRQIRVELEGFHPWEQTVELRADRLSTRAVDLQVVDRRPLWLGTSIGLSAAAAGFLAMGVVYNVRHDDFILGTPEADEHRRLSIVGYAVAGGVAAAAIVSWTLYLLHRRRVLQLTAQ